MPKIQLHMSKLFGKHDFPLHSKSCISVNTGVACACDLSFSSADLDDYAKTYRSTRDTYLKQANA